jgi:PAS domain S-box-containing protein
VPATDQVLSRRGELLRGSLAATFITLAAVTTLAVVPLAALVRVNSIYGQRRRVEVTENLAGTLSQELTLARGALQQYSSTHRLDDKALFDGTRNSLTSVASQLGTDPELGRMITSPDRLVEYLASIDKVVVAELQPAITSGRAAMIEAARAHTDALLEQAGSAATLLVSALQQNARSVDADLGTVIHHAQSALLASSVVTFLVTATAGLTNVRALLTRSEERFRGLVQNTSELLLTTNTAGVVTFCSPSVLVTLHWNRDDVVGHRLVDVIHPDDRDRLDPWFARNDPTSAAPAAPQSVVIRMADADGSYRTGEAIVSVMRGDHRTEDSVVVTVRDVTERLELAEELRRRATQDPGTGLANRVGLQDRLADEIGRARRESGSVALVAFGLNGIRSVRALHGAKDADDVVGSIAERIATRLPDVALIARTSDDELVAVLTSDDTDLEPLYAELCGELSRSVDGGAELVSISVWAGFATSAGEHTPDELTRNAGLALQTARVADAKTLIRFDPVHQEAAADNAALTGDLRRTLAAGGLSLHFQPIVALPEGRLVGAEALARWHHPTRGNVPPIRFIPLAEASGDIEALGRWALNEACEYLHSWQEVLPGFRVTVNVATAQLRDETFVSFVSDTMREWGIHPSGLVLEITESGFASDAVLTHAQRLRELGVGVAIDDFGTGYSTLSYLGRMPVTTLKIDKSFVDRLGDDDRSVELVATIIDLAHSFDLKTVAEGVETAEQAAQLARLGCDYGQGYLFSRPVPAGDIPALLAAPVMGAPS